MIAKMSGWKLVPDAPQRVGDCSLTNCYEWYKRMSGYGMLDMGQADYDEVNLAQHFMNLSGTYLV